MRALAVLLTLLIVLGAGGYYATGTPQYSLYLLARGLQDRDETAVGAHFDTERVAEDAAALFWERARARLRLQFDEATLEARIDEIKPELDRLLRAGAGGRSGRWSSGWRRRPAGAGASSRSTGTASRG